MDYYLGQHDIFLGKPGANEVRVSANYAKYVVDVTLGYYLGEAVKYDANQRRDDGDKAVHDDEMETMTPDLSGSDVIDLSPLLDCYDSQRISQLDLELGRTMGIMGDCMEVCYASSDADPQPRSARISPDSGILVCDSTVEHNKLFGIVWEQRENTNGQKYYCRSTTMPDMTDEQLRKVSRAARDPATGKGITVPGDMKYRDWYKKFVEGHPQAQAREKAVKNKAADRKQFRRYRAVLGENAPKTLDDFQKLKYTDGEKFDNVKTLYEYRRIEPHGTMADALANREIREGRLIKGHVTPIVNRKAYILEDKAIKRDPAHIMKRMNERLITSDEAQAYVDNAIVCISQYKETRRVYFSEDGVTVLTKTNDYPGIEWIAKTVWGKPDFDDSTLKILEVARKYYG